MAAGPDHLLDRRRRQRRRQGPARGDRPDRQRPVLLSPTTRRDPADLRQGDGDGQQVGDQRAAVRAAGRPADADVRRSGPRQRAVPARLRHDPAQADVRGDPGDARRATRCLAWWRYGLGMTRRVHLRRQGPLGRRVADLARLFGKFWRSSSATRCARARPRGSPSRSSRTAAAATLTLDAIDAGRPVHQRGRNRDDGHRPAARRPKSCR